MISLRVGTNSQFEENFATKVISTQVDMGIVVNSKCKHADYILCRLKTIYSIVGCIVLKC